MPNISEISRRVNLPYSTTWKYLKLLRERGFITITRTNRRSMITERDLETFQEFLRLVREEGLSLEVALNRIGEGRTATEEPIIRYLQRLEKKIENLEKENKALSELVQKYLYELEKLKGLPKPKGSLMNWFKGIFKRNH